MPKQQTITMSQWKNTLYDLTADIPKRTIDPKALTIQQLADTACVHVTTARDIARSRVKEGKWEQVFKKVGRQIIPAYRRKQ